MEIDVANIVSAVDALAASYFAYNQYTKNRITDLKVDYFKREEEKKSYCRSENQQRYSVNYGGRFMRLKPIGCILSNRIHWGI